MSLPWQYASVSLLTLSTSAVAYVGSWTAAADAQWQGFASGVAQSLAGSREVRIVRHSDGLFHLRVRIDGVATDAVLDTGASRSIIGRDLQDALSRRGVRAGPEGPNPTLRTMNGKVAYARLPVSRLEVEGFELGPVDAVTLPGSDAPTVIGQDVIARFGSLTITADQLVLR